MTVDIGFKCYSNDRQIPPENRLSKPLIDIAPLKVPLGDKGDNDAQQHDESDD